MNVFGYMSTLLLGWNAIFSSQIIDSIDVKNEQDLSQLEYSVSYVRHERVMSFFPHYSDPEAILVGLYKTTLTNNGPDTITYTSMLCSYWKFNTVSDTNFYPFYKTPCYANWPIDITLAPSESSQEYIYLMHKEGVELDSSELKIGIRVIHPDDYEFTTDCRLYCDTANSVWSDPILVYNAGKYD